MKLISKEICPITVRDRLVKNLANQDIGIMDMKKALEWAEEKCFELEKLCFKLTGENDYLIGENKELKLKYLEAENKAVELHETLGKCTKTLAGFLEE